MGRKKQLPLSPKPSGSSKAVGPNLVEILRMYSNKKDKTIPRDDAARIVWDMLLKIESECKSGAAAMVRIDASHWLFDVNTRKFVAKDNRDFLTLSSVPNGSTPWLGIHNYAPLKYYEMGAQHSMSLDDALESLLYVAIDLYDQTFFLKYANSPHALCNLKAQILHLKPKVTVCLPEPLRFYIRKLAEYRDPAWCEKFHASGAGRNKLANQNNVQLACDMIKEHLFINVRHAVLTLEFRPRSRSKLFGFELDNEGRDIREELKRYYLNHSSVSNCFSPLSQMNLRKRPIKLDLSDDSDDNGQVVYVKCKKIKDEALSNTCTTSNPSTPSADLLPSPAEAKVFNKLSSVFTFSNGGEIDD